MRQKQNRENWPWWMSGLLLIPLIVLIPGISEFPTPPLENAYSDLINAHYPYTLYVRQVLSAGQMPWWSGLNLGGAPLAANPLYGVWYPFGWPAWLLPLPFGFNLLILIHLAFGALGMYRLLIQEGLDRRAALFGGMAFAALPKIYAHYGAGHLTLIYAVCWTPWLFTAWQKVIGSGGRRSDWSSAGMVWGIIWLADVRWGVYGGGAGLLYALSHSFTGQNRASHFKVQIRRAGRVLLVGIVSGVSSLAIAAPLLLPLSAYIPQTTRTLLEPKDVLAFSLPPSHLLNLLIPDFNGYAEWILYPGVVVFCLAWVMLFSRGGRHWIIMLSAGLVWSLGESLPLAEKIASLPGVDLLRVPPRALFISGIGIISLAAYGVDVLLDNELEARFVRRSRLALTGLTAFALLIALGVWGLSGNLPLEFAWGPGLLFVTARWTGSRLTGHQKTGTWLGLIYALLLFDLIGVNYLLFRSMPVNEVQTDGGDAARYILEKLELQEREYPPGRVFSLSYSLPQATAALYQIQMADGIDPLQPAEYAERLSVAAGVAPDGYSVTLPPLAGDDPHRANIGADLDVQGLGEFNINYLSSHYELDEPGLVFEKSFGDILVYRNMEAKSRLRVESSTAAATAEIVSWQPGLVQISAVGPGRLILVENALPGWIAERNGERVAIDPDELFLTIGLETGEQTVVFHYQPPGLLTGLVIGLATWILMGSRVWRIKHRERVELD